MKKKRVSICWTNTAREQLRRLPARVRRGLLAKADELYECTDPTAAHKPLVGALAGFYRITYGRYRAIFTVDRARVRQEAQFIVRIIFIAAGIRKEHDKKDVYRVAAKLVELGLISVDENEFG